MRFTWTSAKAASNLAKHGVAFEAVELADLENALVRATLGHDGGEPRLFALAPIEGRLHALVFSVERASLHVISLRRANTRERRNYAET